MTVKYYVDPKGSHLVFDIQGETVKDCFRKIAEAQEVFEADRACGLCGQPNIQCRVRINDGNEFFELVCADCRGTLALGQTKDNMRLYPKRKGRPEHRGWEEEYKEARAGGR